MSQTVQSCRCHQHGPNSDEISRHLFELGREELVLFPPPMRPMRGAEGCPQVDGGGSDAGPPPSVLPRPLSDMVSSKITPTQAGAPSPKSTATINKGHLLAGYTPYTSKNYTQRCTTTLFASPARSIVSWSFSKMRLGYVVLIIYALDTFSGRDLLPHQHLPTR